MYLGCLWAFKSFPFSRYPLTAYTYGIFGLCGLKTVSSLMADLNVICNTDVNSSHIFSVKNISDCVTFYWLSASGFKTEA